MSAMSSKTKTITPNTIFEVNPGKLIDQPKSHRNELAQHTVRRKCKIKTDTHARILNKYKIKNIEKAKIKKPNEGELWSSNNKISLCN